MKLAAYGKINLSLDITGKRENGYHDVAMVMQSVSLCDDIVVNINDTGTINVKTNCQDIPNNQQNLAYRACELLKNEFNILHGFDITIEKRIPVAGGMAGGSTDAAAVLRAVNELCNLKLSVEQLMERGVLLGADVPFCIQQNPAYATGIGEILTPVCGLPEDLWILFINPQQKLSTKRIYDLVDSHITYGSIHHNALISALQNGNLLEAKKHMINVMQTVSVKECDAIENVIQTLFDFGAIHAMMTGSGATCYGIFSEKPDLTLMQKRFPSYFVALGKPVIF